MIIGNQIRLVSMDSKYCNKVLEWVNDPEIKKMIGTVYPISDTEHLEWFERKQKEKINKVFIIIDLDTDIPIGLTGFNNFNFKDRNTEVFIYIGEQKHLGQGKGTESMKILIDFAFQELNLHKVYLKVFEYNEIAIKSYEKLGFIKEGILIDNVFTRGKYVNTIIMGKINR